MADITKAKAGDTLTDAAVTELARCGLRLPPDMRTVKPKAYGTDGQWLCIDCGHPCENQIDAYNHSEKHGKTKYGKPHGKKQSHRLAWRNFHTGDIEEP